jgi:hypothetical protein
MKNTNNQRDKIIESINILRKHNEKVTTPSVARLLNLSTQWTNQLIKRYEITELVDSYNGRMVLDFLYQFNKECPPFLTRKELYVASQYRGSFDSFKLILWRHKISYRRERTATEK